MRGRAEPGNLRVGPEAFDNSARSADSRYANHQGGSVAPASIHIYRHADAELPPPLSNLFRAAALLNFRLTQFGRDCYSQDVPLIILACPVCLFGGSSRTGQPRSFSFLHLYGSATPCSSRVDSPNPHLLARWPARFSQVSYRSYRRVHLTPAALCIKVGVRPIVGRTEPLHPYFNRGS
jgi:hypothetical protein